MPLSIAAFVPDSPLLIKEINEQQTTETQRLISSFEPLAHLIKCKNITTVILISTGAENLPGAISILHDPVIYGDFNDFGRPDISLSLAHNIKIAYQMTELLEHSNYPIKLLSQQKMDYTLLTPLLLLKEVINGLKIVPCILQGPHESIIKFGKTIRRISERSNENILLLACGEICRTNNRRGKNPHLTIAQEHFSEKILSAIKNNQLANLLSYDEKQLKKFNAQSLATLQTVASCINETKTTNTILAREVHLGINHLNVVFNL